MKPKQKLKQQRKQKPFFYRNKPHLVITAVVAAVVVLVLASGFTGYHMAFQKYNPNKTPAHNVPGYITATAARNEVNNFYEQYLRHPRNEAEVRGRDAFINTASSKGLQFYAQYYQHGFDPIVCLPVMPTSVVATSVQPGWGAVVHAQAKYPGGSTADIVLTLVINNEGFRIDTITCPGALGNLAPAS